MRQLAGDSSQLINLFAVRGVDMGSRLEIPLAGFTQTPNLSTELFVEIHSFVVNATDQTRLNDCWQWLQEWPKYGKNVGGSSVMRSRND
jgi:hypothetical protein